jgi:hypothetical protein
LSVPQEIWEQSIAVMRRYGESRSEALVFWGGIVAGGQQQVTGLYLPDHTPQGGRVQLTDADARWLVRRLRERDEKLLAQVHSHPGSAFHSGGDDERAASFHVGYLSIVAPDFARPVSNVSDCATYEFDGTQFVPLNLNEVGGRIRVLPMVEERERDPVPEPVRDQRRQSWKSWIGTLASSLKPRLTARKGR